MAKTRFPLFFKAAAFGVFLIVASVIVVYFISNSNKKSPRMPSIDEQKLNSRITAITDNFRYVRTEGGRDLYLVTADRDQAFEDGHHTLLNVRLESYGKNSDRKDVITADEASYSPILDQSQGNVEFHKNVNVVLTDGAKIKTEQAIYDSAKKLVTSDSVVSFERPGASGSFKGLLFDTDQSHLLMKSQVNLRVEPKSGSADKSQAVLILAANGEYSKVSGDMRFGGGVTVKHGSDEMRADRMNAFLSATNKITRLEARGNSDVKMSQTDKGYDLKSQDFDLFFTPEQQLEKAEARGGVTINNTDNGPARTVTANTMNVAFAPGPQGTTIKQVTTDGRTTAIFAPSPGDSKSAGKELAANQVRLDFGPNGKDMRQGVATGDAVMTVTPVAKTPQAEAKHIAADSITVNFFETDNLINNCVAQGNVKVELIPMAGGQPPRVTTSNSLVATFDRGTHDINTLTQEGNFKFNEGDRHATAQRAVYTAADATAKLTGGEPTVWDDSARTKAEEISLNTQSGQSEAIGKVRTTYYNREKTGGAAPFSQTRSPIFITANRVEIAKQGSRVVYSGAARAWQEQNFVVADTLTMIQADKQMIADGHVSSALSQIKGNAAQLKGKSGQAATNSSNDKSRKEPPVPVFARAAKMTFDDTKHHLRYEGGVEVKQGTDTLHARTIDVDLAPGTNEVSKMVAETGVSLTEPGRRASGDRLDYNADNNTIILIGNLARVEDDQKGVTSGRQLTFNMSDDTISSEDQRGLKRGHAVYKSQ